MTSKRWIIKWSPLDFEYLEGFKQKIKEEVLPWIFMKPQFGADEYSNHSIHFTIFGLWVVFFYEPRMYSRDRWYFGGCGDMREHWYHHDMVDEGFIEMPVSREGMRYMIGYEHVGIDDEVCCPPPPMSKELMDYYLEIGFAKFVPWDNPVQEKQQDS